MGSALCKASNRKQAMKDFYIHSNRVWVKVSRAADKSFSFVIGYTGDFKGFSVTRYPHDFLPTIADAREMAKIKAADYV